MCLFRLVYQKAASEDEGERSSEDFSRVPADSSNSWMSAIKPEPNNEEIEMRQSHLVEANDHFKVLVVCTVYGFSCSALIVDICGTDSSRP